MKARLATKIHCGCGSITNQAQISRHEKTKKHREYLKKLAEAGELHTETTGEDEEEIEEEEITSS